MKNSLETATQLHNVAVSNFENGRRNEAIQLFRQSLNAGFAASGRALFQIYRVQGNLQMAGELAARVALMDPMHFRFVQDAIDFNVSYACDQRLPYRRTARSLPPSNWTVIVCSHDRRQYSNLRFSLESVTGSHSLQFVLIPDARSMNEGYQRGFELARHDNIVLCHHDIEFLIPDFFDRLTEHFQTYDMIGVAGATQMSGPAILYDGHPHLTSRLIQPGKTEASRLLCSLNPFASIRAAAVLDGVFIAAKRCVLQKIGFDLAFQGFHYYDVDLSYRAYLAGFRIGIATDLALYHHSHGNYSPDWEAAANQFGQKFPNLKGTPSLHRHFYSVPIRHGSETSVWSWLNHLADKYDRDAARYSHAVSRPNSPHRTGN